MDTQGRRWTVSSRGGQQYKETDRLLRDEERDCYSLLCLGGQGSPLLEDGSIVVTTVLTILPLLPSLTDSEEESSSPRSRSSPPRRTVTSKSAESATPDSPLVLPTAERGAVVTLASSDPRRSSSSGLEPTFHFGFLCPWALEYGSTFVCCLDHRFTL